MGLCETCELYMRACVCGRCFTWVYVKRVSCTCVPVCVGRCFTWVYVKRVSCTCVPVCVEGVSRGSM